MHRDVQRAGDVGRVSEIAHRETSTEAISEALGRHHTGETRVGFLCSCTKRVRQRRQWRKTTALLQLQGGHCF